VARRVAGEIVSLPMFPQLTSGQQTRVVEEVLAFTSKTKRVEGQRCSLGPAKRTA
jgi:hypothetical protein